MSPTLNGRSVLQHFERGNVIEMRNRIIFDFYPGLPHIYINVHITLINIATQGSTLSSYQ